MTKSEELRERCLLPRLPIRELPLERMTVWESEFFHLLAECLKQGLISGVDPRVDRYVPAPTPPPLKQAKRKEDHCKGCGICRKCRSDARWDRIYTAKFEWPGYYEKRKPHLQSCLNEF